MPRDNTAAAGELSAYERLPLLTPKEQDCLRLVMEQRSSKQIARELGISRTSVDTHVRRARHKLGLRDRYAAARLLAAWRRGDAPTADADRSPSPEPTPRARFALPPLAGLGFGQRLYLIAGGAVLAAALTGALLTLLAAL